MEENSKNITEQGQIDRDILQCKADILQAFKPSVPAIDRDEPTDEITSQPEDAQENTEELLAELDNVKADDVDETGAEIQMDEDAIVFDDIDEEIEEQIETETAGEIDTAVIDEQIESTLQAETDKAEEVDGQIPQFNLAEQILTAQRRAASTRRRRPASTAGGSGGSSNIAPAEGTIGKIISKSKKTLSAEPIELYEEAESNEPAKGATYQPEEPVDDEPIEFYEGIDPSGLTEPDQPYISMAVSNLAPTAEQIISRSISRHFLPLFFARSIAALTGIVIGSELTPPDANRTLRHLPPSLTIRSVIIS